MRKIFLTSGLILCMFCPAMADISANTSPADCDQTTLGTTSGSVDFESQWTAATYDITYACGTKPSGSSSTLSGSGPSNGSVTYGSTYSLSSSYGSCSLPGYTATGWDCTGGATLTNATGTQTAMSGTSAIACTVHWTPNTLNLNWYQDTVANGATSPFTTGTCVYDSTLTVPTNYTQKNGYHFNGWVVRQ